MRAKHTVSSVSALIIPYQRTAPTSYRVSSILRGSMPPVTTKCWRVDSVCHISGWGVVHAKDDGGSGHFAELNSQKKLQKAKGAHKVYGPSVVHIDCALFGDYMDTGIVLKAHDTTMREFSLDGTKVTELVHTIWRQVVRVGDIVIDATCGNGHDTAVLASLAFGESNQGFVHGFDLQRIAIERTSSFLDKELNISQRERVCLHQMCHSKLGEVIKQKNSVSVVAFNLGYLPGGEKGMTTEPKTSVEAITCATTLLRKGGVITVVSYVGHPGGRDEYEAVREFAARLPTDSWVCSLRECLNRPLCPRLLVLFKK